MKHLGDEDDAAVQKYKIKEMNEKLEQKVDEMGSLELLKSAKVMMSYKKLVKN